MKEYNITAYYTISVDMTIEADNYEDAMDKAYECESAIDTEWTGNSVFVNESALNRDVLKMSVCADGTLRDFECDDYDEEDE